MWNLGEPGSRFRAAAPNHPEALLEEPQAFQAVGEKTEQNRFSDTPKYIYRTSELNCVYPRKLPLFLLQAPWDLERSAPEPAPDTEGPGTPFLQNGLGHFGQDTTGREGLLRQPTC